VVLGLEVMRLNGRLKVYDHRSDKLDATRDVMGWIDEAVDRGAGEIRLMSVDREGRRTGMDIDLVNEVAARARVPVVAEGGAGILDHLADALDAGASGVAVGTMLVFSDNNLVKIKRFLRSRGCKMRN
jgi:cyclase